MKTFTIIKFFLIIISYSSMTFVFGDIGDSGGINISPCMGFTCTSPNTCGGDKQPPCSAPTQSTTTNTQGETVAGGSCSCQDQCTSTTGYKIADGLCRITKDCITKAGSDVTTHTDTYSVWKFNDPTTSQTMMYPSLAPSESCPHIPPPPPMPPTMSIEIPCKGADIVTLANATIDECKALFDTTISAGGLVCGHEGEPPLKPINYQRLFWGDQVVTGKTIHCPNARCQINTLCSVSPDQQLCVDSSHSSDFGCDTPCPNTCSPVIAPTDDEKFSIRATSHNNQCKFAGEICTGNLDCCSQSCDATAVTGEKKCRSFSVFQGCQDEAEAEVFIGQICCPGLVEKEGVCVEDGEFSDLMEVNEMNLVFDRTTCSHYIPPRKPGDGLTSVQRMTLRKQEYYIMATEWLFRQAGHYKTAAPFFPAPNAFLKSVFDSYSHGVATEVDSDGRAKQGRRGHRNFLSKAQSEITQETLAEIALKYKNNQVDPSGTDAIDAQIKLHTSIQQYFMKRQSSMTLLNASLNAFQAGSTTEMPEKICWHIGCCGHTFTFCPPEFFTGFANSLNNLTKSIINTTTGIKFCEGILGAAGNAINDTIDKNGDIFIKDSSNEVSGVPSCGGGGNNGMSDDIKRFMPYEFFGDTKAYHGNDVCGVSEDEKYCVRECWVFANGIPSSRDGQPAIQSRFALIDPIYNTGTVGIPAVLPAEHGRYIIAPSYADAVRLKNSFEKQIKTYTAPCVKNGVGYDRDASGKCRCKSELNPTAFRYTISAASEKFQKHYDDFTLANKELIVASDKTDPSVTDIVCNPASLSCFYAKDPTCVREQVYPSKEDGGKFNYRTVKQLEERAIANFAWHAFTKTGRSSTCKINGRKKEIYTNYLSTYIPQYKVALGDTETGLIGAEQQVIECLQTIKSRITDKLSGGDNVKGSKLGKNYQGPKTGIVGTDGVTDDSDASPDSNSEALAGATSDYSGDVTGSSAKIEAREASGSTTLGKGKLKKSSSSGSGTSNSIVKNAKKKLKENLAAFKKKYGKEAEKLLKEEKGIMDTSSGIIASVAKSHGLAKSVKLAATAPVTKIKKAPKKKTVSTASTTNSTSTKGPAKMLKIFEKDDDEEGEEGANALPANEINTIMKHITVKKYQSREGDSLFVRVHKAHVRSYAVLLNRKKRVFEDNKIKPVIKNKSLDLEYAPWKWKKRTTPKAKKSTKK